MWLDLRSRACAGYESAVNLMVDSCTFRADVQVVSCCKATRDSIKYLASISNTTY